MTEQLGDKERGALVVDGDRRVGDFSVRDSIVLIQEFVAAMVRGGLESASVDLAVGKIKISMEARR